MTEKNSSLIGNEIEKLSLIEKILELNIICLEYGLFPTTKIRTFLRLFFLKTEFINKYEDYISKHEDSFNLIVFKKLMACKSLCAQILLQIVSVINDDWLYYNLKENVVDQLVQEPNKKFNLLTILKRSEKK